jgi:shikimate 5-dehydrogenase
LGFSELAVFDIDDERLERLTQEFQMKESVQIQIRKITKKDLGCYLSQEGLLINATPVGLWPNHGVSPIPDPNLISSGATVFDLIPNPMYTRLLKEAGKRGARIIPGIHMLVAQALAAQEIWLDQKLLDSYFDIILNHLMRNIQDNDKSANTLIG